MLTERMHVLPEVTGAPVGHTVVEKQPRGEAALRGEPRLQTLPVASALTAHRTGPPPISPSKRKFSVDPGDDDLDCDGDHASKMSRIFAPHLNKTANGDCRKDPRERSRSPIERAVAPTMSLHSGPLYASLPSLSMEQPLALTKNSLDAGRPAGLSPTLAPVERQQNRPSVITCASASARNCNLSHCPVAHSGCAAGPASYRRTPSCECPRVPPIPQQGGGLSTPYPPVPRTAASGPLRKAALSQHKGAGLGGGSSPWAPPSRPPSSQGGRRRRPVCMNVCAHGPGQQAQRRDPRRGHPLCGPPSDCRPPTVLQPPATPWWRSTSAGAWARTTRSQSRPPTPCPSRAPWTTTSPRPWATRGSRSRRPRTARPAAPSRPRAGASPPAPRPTWSATAIPRPWSPEGSAALRHHFHLHGLPEL
uniref:Transcription cofactor vestigial-like protein 4 n=1 Tax=Bos mutus grunniens TaxID=30521 RepID=A0A8B9YX71_BOSMU